MIARAFSAVAAAVLLAGAAPQETLSRFDISRAEGWSEALALCDLTEFLLTDPALSADVILARDDGTGQFRPLYGPRFIPPNLLYDGDVKRAYYRLRRAGEVDARSVGEARSAVDRAMLRAFRRYSSTERRFLEKQAETCDGLLTDVRTRYP